MGDVLSTHSWRKNNIIQTYFFDLPSASWILKLKSYTREATITAAAQALLRHDLVISEIPRVVKKTTVNFAEDSSEN